VSLVVRAKILTTREKIITAYAEWTSFSATRSGCPVKSREKVYPLIRIPKYELILNGNNNIDQEEFDEWHRNNTLAICQKESRLPIGWAAKLINIYLKTRVYLAKEGRPSLIKCIHPPIDNELWKGIKLKYGNKDEIISKTHIVSRIKDITTYDIYKKIIDRCRLIAKERSCLLIEVEELWQGNVI
jgi:hypothetical protein